jgi:glutamate formiminotransferase
VGARLPLIAYNVTLATGDLEVAKAIARAIRESSGGLPAVQARGFPTADPSVVQVSTNLLDLRATPLWRLVEEVERRAAARGVALAGCELVGLMPARVAAEAAARTLRLPELAADRLLEVAAFGELGSSGGGSPTLAEPCAHSS